MNQRFPSCVRAFFDWNCKLVVLTGCLGLGACLKSSGACIAAPPGIAAWFQGENDTADISGSLQPGQILNGVGFSAAVKGNGFVFNGVNTYITNSRPMLTEITNSYTVEFWAWPSAARTSTTESTSGTAGTSGQRYAIFPNAGPDVVGSGVSVGNNGVSVFENGNLYVPSLLVYNTSITAWTHVAVVYSNRQPSLYLNGVLVRVGLTSTRNSSPSTSLGAQNNGFNYGYYSGMLDEVTIYNRALSPSEIQAIYSSGADGKCILPPTIITEPSDRTNVIGSAASLTVAISGSPPISRQWLINGVPLPGQTNSTLTIASAQFSDAGPYCLIASNVAGVVTSSIATLTVVAPTPCVPAPNGLMTWFGAEGDTSDSASGLLPGTNVNGVGFAPGLKGQGFVFNGTNSYITSSTPKLLNISDTYTMEFWAWPNAARASTAETVSGIQGTANQRYAIFPAFDGSAAVGAGVSVGTNGISVFEHGNSYLPSLLVKDTPIIGWTHIAVVYSNKQPSLYLNGTLARVGLTSTRDSSPSTDLGEQGFNYGYYSGMLDEVSIYNRALTASEIQSVYTSGLSGKCSMPPTVVAQPANKQIYQNSRADFTATALGAPPLNYQWLFNGVPMPGQTNSTLTIAAAQNPDAGSYSMMASNQIGVATSSIANLTFIASSPCVTAPNGLATWFAGQGDAADAMSGLLPGTIVNGVGFAPGIKDLGFVFDGTSSYITNTTPKLLSVSNTYTMEFWAWPNAARASTAETVSGTQGAGNQRYAIFPAFDGSPAAGAGVSVGTNGVSVFEHSASYLPSLLVYDTPIPYWTHIAVVYSNQQPSLYLNGTLVRTGLASTRASSPSTDLGEQGFGYGYYSGMLDEVSIHNRALTASEIQSIYSAGVNGKCSLPPSFVTQPPPKTLVLNGSGQMTAVATGSPPLAYQWLFSGVPVPGQTSSTLNIASVQFSNDGFYSLMASNSAGVVTSSVARLTVIAPTPCVPAPNGLLTWLRAEGDTTDAASGLLPGTNVNGVGFAPAMKGQGFVFNGTNSYVTNSSPMLSIVSNTYTLEFWAFPNAARASTPETASGTPGTANQRYAIFPSNGGDGVVGSGISVGTNGISVCEHGSSYLPSLLVHDTPISGWTHVALVYSNKQPSLYLNGTLVRTGLTSTRNSSPSTSLGEKGYNYGYYSGMLDEVSIYNRALTLSEIQAIYRSGTNGKCSMPPSFVVQPASNTVYVNITADFSAVVRGAPPLSYQWLFNGVPMAGQTNPTLTIVSPQFSDAGPYSLIASNPVGVVTSSIAQLTVVAPTPCIPAPGGLVAWLEGANDARDAAGNLLPASTINAVGFAPAMKGQGFVFNGTNSFIKNATPVLATITNSYTMEFWAWPNAARNSTTESTYNQFGVAGQRFAIFPYPGPDNDVGSGVSVGTNGVSVFEDGNGSFPNSYLPSLLVYDTPITRWTHIAVVYSNRQPNLYLNGTFVHSGLTSGRDSSPSTSLGEMGLNYGYYSGMLDEVGIYNRALTASEIQSIYASGINGKCSLAPFFSNQPADKTVVVNGAGEIAAVAGGSSPVGYQWLFNGVPVPGQTNFILGINPVQFSDAGSYSLRASNLLGVATSSIAHLTVVAPTPCLTAPIGLVTWLDGGGNTRDAMGTLPPGTNVNGVGFASAIKGQGFVFNGTNSYITNPTPKLTSISNTYTMEFWAWPNAARASTPESTSGTAGTANQRYAIFPSFSLSENYNLSAVIAAGVSVGTNGVSVFEHGTVYMPSPLVYDTPINYWTHIAVVYSNRQPSLYINGVLARVGLASGQNTSPSTALGEMGYSYGYYSGMLDEVSIYNRALTASELRSIYLSGLNGKCSLAPAIVTQPADTTVLVGGKVEMFATLSGSSPSSYQWFFNGTPRTDQTNSVLAIASAQLSDDGLFFLVASNSAGAVTSSVARLTVVAPSPCITTPLGLVTWLAGQNDARDSTGRLLSGTETNGVGYVGAVKGEGFVFNGSNSYVLYPTRILSDITNNYTMEFWAWPNAGQGSSASGTTNQRYAIFPDIGTNNVVGVGVSVGTNGISVFEHGNSYFPAVLVHDANITAWTHVAVVYSNRQSRLYLNGVLAEVGLTSGRDSSPSTCLGEEGFGFGYYSGMLDEVSVYNRALTPSEIQTIYLSGRNGKCSAPPAFITQPGSRAVLVGSPVDLPTVVSGDSPMALQWQLNGVALPASTGLTLHINAAQLSDSGSYTLVASNALGAITSVVATVTVAAPTPCISPPPSGIVSWWEGQNDTWDTAGSLAPGAIVSGAGFAPGVKGQGFVFNGTNGCVTNAIRVLSGVTNTYTTEFWAWPNAARASTPESASGTIGTFNQRYAIFPNNGGSGVVGSGVSLGTNGVSVFEHGSGYMPSLLVYDAAITNWTHVAVVYSNRQPSLYLNGALVRTGLMSSNTSSPSTCLGEQGLGYGYYGGLLDEVSIYNRALAPSEIQAIYFASTNGKCSLPPTFISNPVDQPAFVGNSASFSGKAAGSSPLTYQWLFNNVPLSGETNATLTISAVQFTNAGSYVLQASNLLGVTASQPAVLSVLSCLAPLTGLVTWMEGENDFRDAAGTLAPGTNMFGVGFGPAVRGQGFVFNGANFITNSTPVLASITNSFTMEFWAWPDSARTSTTESTSGVSGNANQRYAIFPNNGGSGNPGAGVSVGTNGVSVFEHASSYLPSLLVYPATLTNWTHIAVVYSNRQPSLYLNGVLARVGLTSTRTSNPSTCLGEQGLGYGNYSGLLDEVGIYNRPLAASEIQALYAAGAHGRCSLAPSFTTQPVDSHVLMGKPCSFSAMAKGTSPLVYQWLFNGTPLAGKTGTTLTLTSAQVSDSGSYSLMASNISGLVTSSIAVLTVSTPAPCVPAPNGLMAWLEGQNDATDAAGALLPSANINGVAFAPGVKGQGFVFNGTNSYITNSSPTLSSITNTYTMEFWAWPAAGRTSSSESTSSSSGTSGQRYAIFPFNNGVSVRGAGVSVGTNGVSVVENGWTFPGLPIVTPVLVYNTPITNWTHVAVVYSNKQPSLYLDGALVRVGLTSTSASTPSTSLGEKGQGYGYYAGMLDEVSIYNRALTAAEIQAIYFSSTNGKCSLPPTITTQPADATVLAGTTARFLTQAYGAAPLAYQWFINGNSLAGQASSSVTIGAASISDAGFYNVVLSNAVGAITSSTATLTVVGPSPCVAPPSGIAAWFEGQNDARDAIGNLTPGVLVNGVGFSPGVKGQAFLFNGTNSYITNSIRMLSSITNAYTMEFWAWPKAGRTSTAENTSGSTGTSSQRYAIFPNNGGSSVVGAGISIGTNGVSVFESGTSYLPSLLVYDTLITNWTHVAVVYSNQQPSLYLNGTLVRVGRPSTRSSSPSTSLGEQGSGFGYYAGMLDEVSIYNRALTPSEIQTTYLTGTYGRCSTAPVFTIQPIDQSVLLGTPAYLSALAGGSSPMTFQWLFNGSLLPGQTNQTLNLWPTQLSDTGGYALVANNPFGMTTSSIATLTVTLPTPCVPPAPGLSAWLEGENDARDTTAVLSPGTLGNGVGFAPGFKGQAFVFNGTSGYISNTIRMLSSVTNNYTMEFWVWPNASRASTVEAASGTPGTANQRYAIFPNSGSNGVVVGAGVSVGTNGVSVFEHANSYLPSLLVYDTAITNWAHVAVAYSNQQPRLYLNGVLVRTGIMSTRISSPSTWLGEQGYGFGYFSGLLDEVSIYDRALTSAEIQAIYLAAGNGKCGPLATITQQPVPVTTNAGASVNFAVAASSPTPMYYRWFKNSTAVGSNAVQLLISNVTRLDGGSYSVQISNNAGTIMSSNALLKVVVPQKFGVPVVLAGGTIGFVSKDSDGGLLTSNDLNGFTAQVSSNLLTWTTLSNSLSLTNGMLLIKDPCQTNFSSRFYRLYEK